MALDRGTFCPADRRADQDRVSVVKVCGDCIYREPVRRVCLLNLAYQSFVDSDTPANGCTGYHEAERATAEPQAQSETRGPAGMGIWQQVWGKKP